MHSYYALCTYAKRIAHYDKKIDFWSRECQKRSPCLSTWWARWSRRYVVVDEPSMALLFLAWLREPLFYAVCLAAEAHGILLELLSLLLANKYWRNCISPALSITFLQWESLPTLYVTANNLFIRECKLAKKSKLTIALNPDEQRLVDGVCISPIKGTFTYCEPWFVFMKKLRAVAHYCVF